MIGLWQRSAISGRCISSTPIYALRIDKEPSGDEITSPAVFFPTLFARLLWLVEQLKWADHG
jgi:hypothetical protein